MVINTITHRKKLIVTLILVCVGVSACGFKAPLYYPTPAQRAELEAKEKRIQARKEARRAQERADREARKAQAEKEAQQASEHNRQPDSNSN